MGQRKVVVDKDLCSEVEALSFYANVRALEFQLEERAKCCQKFLESRDSYETQISSMERDTIDSVRTFTSRINEKKNAVKIVRDEIFELQSQYERLEVQRKQGNQKRNKERSEIQGNIDRYSARLKEIVAFIENFKEAMKILEDSLKAKEESIVNHRIITKIAKEKLQIKSIAEYANLRKHITNVLANASERMRQEIENLTSKFPVVEKAVIEISQVIQNCEDMERILKEYTEQEKEEIRQKPTFEAALAEIVEERRRVNRRFLSNQDVARALAQRLLELRSEVASNMRWKKSLGSLRLLVTKAQGELAASEYEAGRLHRDCIILESQLQGLNAEVKRQLRLAANLDAVLRRCGNAITRNLIETRDPDEDEEQYAERGYDLLRSLLNIVMQPLPRAEITLTEIVVRYHFPPGAKELPRAKRKDKEVQATQYAHFHVPPDAGPVRRNVALQCDIFTRKVLSGPQEGLRIDHALLKKKEGKLLSEYGMFTAYCDILTKINA